MENKLEIILEEQCKLNSKIVSNFKDIMKTEDINLKREWIKNFSIAMQVEIAELLESSGYKWWKELKDWDEETVHNIKIELIDVFHFLLSGMLVLDMDANEIFNLYMAKKDLNVKRQDEGYKTGEYEKIDENGKEDNYYLNKT